MLRVVRMLLVEWVISKFNGTSTPKGSYSAKTGVKLPYESKQSPLMLLVEYAVKRKCKQWAIVVPGAWILLQVPETFDEGKRQTLIMYTFTGRDVPLSCNFSAMPPNISKIPAYTKGPVNRRHWCYAWNIFTRTMISARQSNTSTCSSCCAACHLLVRLIQGMQMTLFMCIICSIPIGCFV